MNRCCAERVLRLLAIASFTETPPSYPVDSNEQAVASCAPAVARSVDSSSCLPSEKAPAVEMDKSRRFPFHLRLPSARPPKLRAPRPVRLEPKPASWPGLNACSLRPSFPSPSPSILKSTRALRPPKRRHHSSIAAFTGPLTRTCFHNSSPAMAAAMTLTATGAD